MKRKIGLLLTAIMALSTVSTTVYGFTNPLKSYNLYEDTHPKESAGSDDRETVMDEFYSNSLAGKGNGSSESRSSDSDESDFSSSSIDIPAPKRNADLRESSQRSYSDEGTPGWLEGPSFYTNPSFESIKNKYKQSNFAGCLQECISYVRLHPNDTLGYYYLAMCYTKVSDKENAVRAYEKVISLHENPMIVKYATNGRNCILGIDDEHCYPKVNEPELIYPYAHLANKTNLTPVDPETLVNRNLKTLQQKLSPLQEATSQNQSGKESDKKNVINLPFGTQDDKLDSFINAPYGNGLSPDLNKEYKQLQLRKFQETINNGESNYEKNWQNIDDIKKFDKQKSDSGNIKLAYVATSDNEFEKLKNDSEFQQSQRELNELRMLLGNNSTTESSNRDLTDLIPYMTEKDKNLSPEVIQAMMIKSMMPDFTFVDSNSKNLL